MNTWLRGQLQIEVEEPLLRIGKGKTFFENSIVRSLLLMQTISFVALAGLFSFFLRPSKSLTVLHYNVYFGVDLLGAWWQTLIFGKKAATAARRIQTFPERMRCGTLYFR